MRFQPGVSGNPRGRPKSDLAIAELAKAHTATAIASLVSIMESADAPPAARVSAASALLDRGWGRPAQTINTPAPDVIHQVRWMTPEEAAVAAKNS